MSDTLADELDQRVLVYLRDGRTFIGLLRSYDQFANLLLESAVERVVVNNEAFADVPCGLRVLRGENVVLFGRVDDGGGGEGEAAVRRRMRQVSAEEIRRMEAAAAADREAVRRRERLEWPVTDDAF